MALRSKLIGAFVIVAFLLGLTSGVSVCVSSRLTSHMNVITTQASPSQIAVLRAALAVAKLRSTLSEFIRATSGLEGLEEKLRGYSLDLPVWLTAVARGTDSEEFAGGVFGKRFQAG